MKIPRALLFVIPLMTVITVGLGLRIGAEKRATAARLFSAPAPARSGTLAWQLFTYANERGVDEAVALSDLTVTATAHGETVIWRGASSARGIAEISLGFQTLRPEDTVSIEARVGHEAAPLLSTQVLLSSLASGDAPSARFVRPIKREGALVVDLIPLDGQLPAGFASRVFVRATDASGRPIPRLGLTLAPEPGLTTPERITTCDNGWAEFEATAVMHVNELRVTTENADPAVRGEWLGALPVSPGASDARFSRTPTPGKPFPITIAAGNSRTEVFVEINDERGRVFAGEFPFQDANGQRRASFDAPALRAGTYWLVTSGTPAGAEDATQTGSLSRPFRVHNEAISSCELGKSLASSQKSRFPRTLVKDSKTDRHARDRANKTVGLTIALTGLVIGALLETLLLLGAVRKTAMELGRAATEEGDAAALAGQASGTRLVVGVLLSLLGFSLLAAIVVWASR